VPGSVVRHRSGNCVFSLSGWSGAVLVGRFLIAKQGRRLSLSLFKILYPLLDTALETMGSQSTTSAGSIGIRLTHPKTPGRPVLGHGASQIGIISWSFSGADSFTIFGGSGRRHNDFLLSCEPVAFNPVPAQPVPNTRKSPIVSM
jgi:hypothetical protein